MRTVLAGSKCSTTYDDLIDAINAAPFDVTSIISGTNRWVDELGEYYANEHSLKIHRIRVKPEYGKDANFIQKMEMVAMAEALIVLWGGMTQHTECLVNLARNRQIPIFNWIIKAV